MAYRKTNIDVKNIKIPPVVRAPYLTKVTWTDKVLATTVLKILPPFVTPNRITIFRFLTIPVIIYLLLRDDYTLGLILFMISAFSDAVDGAMARTKKLITDWGILYDPLADKLLIGSVAAIVVSKYIHVYIALLLVSIEILLVVSAYYRYRGKAIPAKVPGKIKMILQSVGISTLLLYAVLPHPVVLAAGAYTIYASIFFALLSLTIYRSV